MANEDVVGPDGTWTGHEERIEDAQLIEVVPPSKTRLTLREADEVLRRLGGGRR